MIRKLINLNSYYKGPKSAHFNGKIFLNTHGPNKKHSLRKVLHWHLKRQTDHWPNKVLNKFSDCPPQLVDGNDIRISFVGHVTFLIQTQGINILTDPVWSKRASPFHFIGPKRIKNPGIEFKNLPPIDAVWVSHNHYDHLDISTLRKLWKYHKPRIITPLGNDTIMQKAGISSEAYDLWQCVCLAETINLHLYPMLHWSARGLFDKNKALWAAMVLETPAGNIYFVGDSGYGDGFYFRQAQEKFNSFKAALLPIGAYEPRWLTGEVHMSPLEALKAQQDLGNPLMIPMHYDTFPLADEGYNQALLHLEQGLKDFPNSNVKILEVGEHIYL